MPPVIMIVRRKTDYQDGRLIPLRQEGVSLLKKHGAISHRFGYYHLGPRAGQIFVEVDPDLRHTSGPQGMAQHADWQRVHGWIEEIAPLEEVSVAVVTGER